MKHDTRDNQLAKAYKGVHTHKFFAQASGLMFRDGAWVLLEFANLALARELAPQCEKRLCPYAASLKASLDGCVAMAEIHAINILADSHSASTEHGYSATPSTQVSRSRTKLDVRLMSAHLVQHFVLHVWFLADTRALEP